VLLLSAKKTSGRGEDILGQRAILIHGFLEIYQKSLRNLIDVNSGTNAMNVTNGMSEIHAVHRPRSGPTLS